MISCSKTGHCTENTNVARKTTILTNLIIDGVDFKLSFFQKLMLCLGLNFALPQCVSPIELKASFEKAYWSLQCSLSDEKMKELDATKALLAAIEELERRDDIVITKPDKGSGVVVMDKQEFLRLLSEASVNDTSKFRAVPLERKKNW